MFRHCGKKKISNFFRLFISLPFFAVAWPVKAITLPGLENAANHAFNGASNIPLKSATNTSSILARVGVILGTILSFLGVIFLILIIYAGLLWMTAHGNDTQVKKAQTIMYQATVGLIIVLGAYAITAFMGSILK